MYADLVCSRASFCWFVFLGDLHFSATSWWVLLLLFIWASPYWLEILEFLRNSPRFHILDYFWITLLLYVCCQDQLVFNRSISLADFLSSLMAIFCFPRYEIFLRFQLCLRELLYNPLLEVKIGCICHQKFSCSTNPYLNTMATYFSSQ